jgi:hypothetical protein
MRLRIVFPIIAMLLVCSCREPRRPLDVGDAELTVKAPAIRKAVREADYSVAGQLVADLDDDDAAVRFYAIQGLRRLTGQDYGYEYYFSREQRLVPLLRWQAWHARQQVWQDLQASRRGD